ncbi:MAG: DUF721 domain-containing protein [bacterium]|nr:DUF721 domain-containing protein [bacterium]
MRRDGFISVEEIIARMVGNLEDGRRLREELSLLVWEDVVGKAISRHTSPQRVISGIMTVNTDGSAWAQELSLQKEEIKKRLNARVGFDLVKDIRFRTGAVRSQGSDSKREMPSPQEDDCRTAQDIINVIEDKPLAESFGRFLEHELCRQRIRRERGWVKCICCGALHAGKEDMCIVCRQKTFEGSRIRGVKFRISEQDA